MRFLTIAAAMLATAPAIADKPPITARIVTADQRHACKYLGLVNVRAAMGTNKPARALNMALRKAQDMGGNGLYLIGQTKDWAEGATVSGEALSCPTEQL